MYFNEHERTPGSQMLKYHFKGVCYTTDDATLLVISFSYEAAKQKCSLSLQILHG